MLCINLCLCGVSQSILPCIWLHTIMLVSVWTFSTTCWTKNPVFSLKIIFLTLKSCMLRTIIIEQSVAYATKSFVPMFCNLLYGISRKNRNMQHFNLQHAICHQNLFFNRWTCRWTCLLIANWNQWWTNKNVSVSFITE